MWRVVVILAACTSRGPAEHLGWNSMPSLPTPRAGHATCVVGNELTVVGGTEESGSSDVLVLRNGKWLARASLTTGRTDPVCAEIYDRLFVFGGGPPHGEVLEPNSGSFHELASTTPFGAGAALFATDAKIFAFGGGGPTSVYDVPTDTWSPLAQEPVGRRFAGATWRFNFTTMHTEIWIFGGQTNTDPDGVRAIDVYDLDADKWRSGGETAAPFVNAVAFEDGDGSMLVVGRVVSAPGEFIIRTDLGTITDDAITQWTFRPAPKTVRTLSGANNGSLVLAGGQTNDDRPTTTVEYFVSLLPR